MSISEIIPMQTWLNSVTDAPALVMIGRSNVGKSSLINALFGNSIAKVSQTPGKTRSINIFEIAPKNDSQKISYMVDLPGHGFAKISHTEREQWDQLLGSFMEALPHNFVLLIIQDARHPMQENEVEMLHYLMPLENRKIMVFNKIDKLKTQKDRNEFKKKVDHYSQFLTEEYFSVSALDKLSLKTLAQLLNKIFQ